MTSCAVRQPRTEIGPEDAVFAFRRPHRASAGRREGVPPRFRARHPAEIAAALGLDGGLISGEMSRETAEAVARAARAETGASHALAVLDRSRRRPRPHRFRRQHLISLSPRKSGTNPAARASTAAATGSASAPSNSASTACAAICRAFRSSNAPISSGCELPSPHNIFGGREAKPYHDIIGR